MRTTRMGLQFEDGEKVWSQKQESSKISSSPNPLLALSATLGVIILASIGLIFLGGFFKRG
jgi:hypothetical protein